MKLELEKMSFTDTIFSLEIQMWFLGFADILMSINEKLNTWPETVHHILKVPVQLAPYIIWPFGKMALR